eukprot:m.147637 g.147637  ORF g.147637 m.147637 type:complete len:93 (-) comp20574_c2_seq1:100-378(-)
MPLLRCSQNFIATTGRGFSMNGANNLAGVNEHSGSTNDIDSVLYRWNGMAFAAVHPNKYTRCLQLEAISQRLMAAQLAGWLAGCLSLCPDLQ